MAERETPDRVIEAVGRRIAEIRRERGWTQDEAAERLGVSVRQMKRLEKGTNLTLHSLVTLAHKFGVSSATLFAPPVSWATRSRGRPKRLAVATSSRTPPGR